MTKELKFFSRVTNGKLAEGVSLTLRELIKKMEGINLVITVKEQGKKRSDAQNAFFWGYVVPPIKQMFEDAGTPCTPEDVHCYLKEHVLGMMKVMVLPDGSRRAVVESSTKKDTKEWEDNMEKIRAWAAQWGVVVPYPHENLEPPSWIDEALQGETIKEYRA